MLIKTYKHDKGTYWENLGHIRDGYFEEEAELDINLKHIVTKYDYGVREYIKYKKLTNTKTKKFMFFTWEVEDVVVSEEQHYTPHLYFYTLSNGIKILTTENIEVGD